MSTLEMALSLLTGSVAGVGAWAWTKGHTHPDLVSRQEIEPQLELILAELRYLRERIDHLS